MKQTGQTITEEINATYKKHANYLRKTREYIDSKYSKTKKEKRNETIV